MTVALECAEPLALAEPLGYADGLAVVADGRGPWADRIDRASRLIRGVKVCGLVSVNPGRLLGFDDDRPYRYSDAALAAAVPLYEGITVYCDHPTFTYDADGARSALPADRKVAEVFGRLENVRHVPGDGLYADLRYLESHPDCGMVLEAAEWMPDKVALSHNATRFVPRQTPDGVVIERIDAVRSVDLIGERPGTTKSLYESAPPAPAATPNTTGGPMDGEMLAGATPDETAAEEAVETPAEESTDINATAEETVTGGFRQAIVDLLDGFDGGDVEALKSQVVALIDQMAAAKSVIAGDAAGGEAVDATATESAAALAGVTDPQARSVILRQRAEIAALKSRDKARGLLAESGLPTTPALIGAVAGCASESGRRDLIASFKSLRGGKAAAPPARSAPPNQKPAVESARTAEAAKPAAAAATESAADTIKRLRGASVVR